MKSTIQSATTSFFFNAAAFDVVGSMRVPHQPTSSSYLYRPTAHLFHHCPWIHQQEQESFGLLDCGSSLTTRRDEHGGILLLLLLSSTGTTPHPEKGRFLNRYTMPPSFAAAAAGSVRQCVSARSSSSATSRRCCELLLLPSFQGKAAAAEAPSYYYY